MIITEYTLIHSVTTMRLLLYVYIWYILEKARISTETISKCNGDISEELPNICKLFADSIKIKNKKKN